MKKNVLIISIICLFVITLSYTYSAFKNTIKGTITATTNNWKFSVSVTGGVKEKDYYKVPINSTSGSFNIVLNNIGSKHYAEYTIELEKVNLPDNFVLNNSSYEGILSNESKTISVSYSSTSSVNGYIKVKNKAVKAEFAVMKNGHNNTTSSVTTNATEFWADKYIKTITFNNNISNMPSSCTESNLCWDISEDENQSKKVYGYLLNSGEVDSKSNTLYNLYIVSEYEIYAPVNCAYLFYSFSGLAGISFNNNFNTSNVTNMNSLFCESSLSTLDLSNFDTSKVTDMSAMFSYCSSLISLDLSSFNTSKVIDMRSMFNNCKKMVSLDLTSFNTVNVTDMTNMFYVCSALTSLNLSNFNTSNVTNMSSMFQSCSSLTSLNVSNFNTSNVTGMNSMFKGCNLLTTLNISNFNTSSVGSMADMFYNCSKLTSLNLSNFNTGNVTTMGGMFSKCSALTSLNLSNFNTSKVTNMRNMFSECSALTSLNLSNFNTSNVTDMFGMFQVCSVLITLDLSHFNTSKVTDMSFMFSDCQVLTSLNVSGFDTSNVTDMEVMFGGSWVVRNVDVSGFNTYVTIHGFSRIYIKHT